MLPPAELGHAALACIQRGRQAPRELWPLPLLREPSPWRSGTSGGRRMRQRVGRRCHEIADANDAIRAVNWCYGAAEASSRPPTAAQREALAHIVGQIRESGAPPPDLDPQAARCELLGSAAGYGGSGASIVAPYDKDLLSIPKLGAAPTPLTQVLEGEPLQCLVRFKEEMLKSEDEWGLECERGQHVKPYFDPGFVAL